MTCLKTMTAEWLQQRGYHGLVNADGECGCSCASPEDFMSCGEPSPNCDAAIELHIEGDAPWSEEPQWFSPADSVLPDADTRVCVRVTQGEFCCDYRKSIHSNLMVFVSAETGISWRPSRVLAWRYDLPPGSWEDGDDQSKLPVRER